MKCKAHGECAYQCKNIHGMRKQIGQQHKDQITHAQGDVKCPFSQVKYMNLEPLPTHMGLKTTTENRNHVYAH